MTLEKLEKAKLLNEFLFSCAGSLESFKKGGDYATAFNRRQLLFLLPDFEKLVKEALKKRQKEFDDL